MERKARQIGWDGEYSEATSKPRLGPRPGNTKEFPDGSRIYTCRSSDTCRSVAAKFGVGVEELLELNRNNYPALSAAHALVYGSPLELPRAGGEHALIGRKHALTMKRRRCVVEEWLEVEVLAASRALQTRCQAVLMYRSDGQHLVWQAGATMSPAEFCRLSGNTRDPPRECILLSRTRQTLAQYEISVREQTRFHNPKLSHLVAHAATASSTSHFSPKIGNFVTLFIPPSVGAQLPSFPVAEVGAKEVQLQREHHQAPEQELQGEPETPSHLWARALSEQAGQGKNVERTGVQRGILIHREINGWYQVLLVEGTGNGMVGSHVVRVRGYQIMQQTGEEERAEAKECVQDWVRQLRRVLFSLESRKGHGHMSEEKESVDLSSKENRLKECIKALRADISRFQIGQSCDYLDSVASSASSSKVTPSATPILCTLARTVDMNLLGLAADWIERARPKDSDSQTEAERTRVDAAEKMSETLREDHDNAKTRRRGERVKEGGSQKEKEKEKVKDGDGESERGGKRLRTRASSGGNRHKDLIESDKNRSIAQEKTIPHEDGKNAQNARGAAREQDDETTVPCDHKRMRWTESNACQIPSHIAQCLIHRNAIQTSVSPIAQKLLQQFMVSANHTNLGGQATVGPAIGRSRAQEQQNCATEVDTGKADFDHDAVKETNMGVDEETIRNNLEELEGKRVSLQKQLAGQANLVNTQLQHVHRLQEKQDVDIARASQEGKHVALAFPEMPARQEALLHSMPLLTALRAHVIHAASGLQMRSAQALCRAANEARVFVAVLLAEKSKLRKSLKLLRGSRNAAAASGPAPSNTSSACSVSGSVSRDSDSMVMASVHAARCGQEGVVDRTKVDRTKVNCTAGASSTSSSVPLTAASSCAKVMNAISTREVITEPLSDVAMRLQQVEAQLSEHANLESEMTTAASRLLKFSRAAVSSLASPVSNHRGGKGAIVDNVQNTPEELSLIYSRIVRLAEEMLVMLPPVDFSGACAPDASGLLGSDPGGDGSKDGDSGGRTAWDADGGAGLDRMLQTRSEIGGFSRIAFCPGLAAWQVNTRENGTTSNRCADPAATLGGVMGGGGCHSSVSQESAKHGDQRSPSVHDAKECDLVPQESGSWTKGRNGLSLLPDESLRARCKAQLRQGYVRVLRSYSDDQDQVQRGDRQLIGHSLPEFLPVAGPSSNISSAHVVHAGVEQDGGTQDANTNCGVDAEQRNILSRKLAARLQASHDY